MALFAIASKRDGEVVGTAVGVSDESGITGVIVSEKPPSMTLPSEWKLNVSPVLLVMY